MSPLKSIALAVTAAAAAGSALAAPQRITDTQWVEANRCLGLMSDQDFSTDFLPALKAFVDQWLHVSMEDGSFQKIYGAWFD